MRVSQMFGVAAAVLLGTVLVGCSGGARVIETGGTESVVSVGEVDIPEILDIKRVIRESEAVAGIEVMGLTR